MPENLLTARQVEDSFGFARTTLLRWEADGKIKPARTPGGQRRYDRKDIERALAGTASPTAVAAPERPRWNELGESGYSRWLEDREEPLRELAMGSVSRWKLLREMRLNDPVIAATFFAIENSLKQATWRVAPASESKADRECAAFVETCLHDQSLPWADTLDHILLMLEQGTTALEIVYKRRLGPEPPNYCNDPAPSAYSDGKIGWRKWAPRPVETLVSGDEFVMDDRGGIQGINQWTDKGPLFIPIERLLLFRTTVVPAGTPWGRPVHRSMYTSYYFTKNFQEIEGIGVERDLAGIPVVYLGNDCTTSGPNSDFELAKDLVVNLRKDEQAGIVIPHPKMGTAAEGQGMLVELLSTNGARAHNAQPLSAKILTPTGWTTMGEIKVGDKVVCPLGFESVIENIFPLGVRPVYKITTSDGRTTLADAEHLWVLTNRNWRPKKKVVDSHPILQNCKIFTTNEVGQMVQAPDYHLTKLYLPETKSVEYEFEPQLPISPYILGVLIGDGWCRTRGGGPQFVSADDEIVECVETELNEKQFLTKRDVVSIGRAKLYQISDKLVGSEKNQTSPTRKALIDLGLVGVTAKSKFIPKSYLTASIKDRLDLLQGLLDTDGHVSKKGRIVLVTASKQLAHDTTELIRSLGGNASIHGYKVNQYTQPCNGEKQIIDSVHYHVGDIHLPSGMVPFRLSRKIARLHEKRQFCRHNGIESVEYVGEMEVQCIKVSSPSQMYFTDDFIPTHNTGEIIARYDKLKTLSVLTQFIMLGLDRTGSYALSRNQNDLFVLAISAWLQKIADVINRIAIPRLVRYNVFPDITGMPKIQPSEVGIPDLEAVANFVNQLVGREVIQPDPELERHLRQMARLPERKVTEGTDATPVKPKHDAMDTALVLRRVLLALKELPTYEGLTDEQLIAMLDPLLSQLKLAIEAETGLTIAVPDTDLLADNADSPNITARTNAARNGSDDVVTADADSAADDEQRRPVKRQRIVR